MAAREAGRKAGSTAVGRKGERAARREWVVAAMEMGMEQTVGAPGRAAVGECTGREPRVEEEAAAMAVAGVAGRSEQSLRCPTRRRRGRRRRSLRADAGGEPKMVKHHYRDVRWRCYTPAIRNITCVSYFFVSYYAGVPPTD